MEPEAGCQCCATGKGLSSSKSIGLTSFCSSIGHQEDATQEQARAYYLLKSVTKLFPNILLESNKRY